MICKVWFVRPSQKWQVEKYEGKNLVSKKEYRKVFFKRPVETEINDHQMPVLVTKAGLIVESENGDVVSLEF